jgi:hypothetical protein
MGAAAPVAFLLLDQVKEGLPAWALVLLDVNVSGFLSFALAAAGMIGGSLLTQRSHPPVLLTPPEEHP